MLPSIRELKKVTLNRGKTTDVNSESEEPCEDILLSQKKLKDAV